MQTLPHGAAVRLRLRCLLHVLLALGANASQAETASAAQLYWANSVQWSDGHTVGYASRQEAAEGGVAYWCGLPANARFFKSCSFGGVDASNVAAVVTNRGRHRLISVYSYWACPPGRQMLASWSENGVTMKPACMDWAQVPKGD